MSFSRMKNSNWLYAHKKSITSQFGEDGIIEKIFEIIGPKNKWCVEFGAGDGVLLSNTWNLIVNKGWRGVQIERDQLLFSDLEDTYADFPVFCLNASVGFLPSDRSAAFLLDKILHKYPIPKDFDFLSIDVDNIDYRIWETFVDYRPYVVCIEFCQTFKHEEEFIYGQDNVHSGSSLKSIVDLGKRKGYELICVSGVNAFFVVAHLYPLFEIKSNDPINYRQYILEGDGASIQ